LANGRSFFFFFFSGGGMGVCAFSTTDRTVASRFGEEMRKVWGRCCPAALGDSARSWT
jgi:hypothetical protein